jgi:hypothetical protein
MRSVCRWYSDPREVSKLSFTLHLGLCFPVELYVQGDCDVKRILAISMKNVGKSSNCVRLVCYEFSHRMLAF